MLNLARNRAKKQDVPFDLEPEDIFIPVFCPVLGIKLERASTGSGRNDNAPSLDRIIPTLGYVRGNVIVISNKANRMKSNGTAADLRRLADFYTKLERKQQCQTTTSKSGAPTSATSTASRSPSLPSPQKTIISPMLPRSSTTRSMASNVTALIDGDIFAYKASFGNESVIPIGDDMVHLEANLAETEATIEHLIYSVKEKLGAQQIIVAMSDDEKNFRKSIYEGYKRARNLVRKPLALSHAKKFIREKFDAKIKDALEADDVLGILATHPTLVKGKPVIVTIDKDLLQIPGRHFNPDKELKRMVSETQGNEQFYMQVLTGDSVDNYPGCPGIGPKRAAALLDEAAALNFDHGVTWEAIIAAYKKAKLTEEDALIQARVARILRNSDYDFTRKEPILWTP